VRALRLALLAICLGLGFVGATPPLRARAAVTTYVDRRVSALPAQQLMTADPRHEIDERRQQIAGTLVLYRHLLFFVWAFSQIYVLYLVWTTGFAARMRDTLRRIAPNPVVLRFLYGVGLALIAGLASVPASLAQYRVGLVFDQTSEAIGPWLRVGRGARAQPGRPHAPVVDLLDIRLIRREHRRRVSRTDADGAALQPLRTGAGGEHPCGALA
jgi:hypothetical protein